MFNCNPCIGHLYPFPLGGGILVDHWSTVSSYSYVCVYEFSQIWIWNAYSSFLWCDHGEYCNWDLDPLENRSLFICLLISHAFISVTIFWINLSLLIRFLTSLGGLVEETIPSEGLIVATYEVSKPPRAILALEDAPAVCHHRCSTQSRKHMLLDGDNIQELRDEFYEADFLTALFEVFLLSPSLSVWKRRLIWWAQDYKALVINVKIVLQAGNIFSHITEYEDQRNLQEYPKTCRVASMSRWTCVIIKPTKFLFSLLRPPVYSHYQVSGLHWCLSERLRTLVAASSRGTFSFDQADSIWLTVSAAAPAMVAATTMAAIAFSSKPDWICLAVVKVHITWPLPLVSK